MAVVQIPLDIPDDILARVMTGEYVRAGGVIRDLAGRLVKLLDDASPGAASKEAASATIAKALTRPKPVAMGLGVVVAATAGGVAFVTARRKKAAETKLPARFEACNASFTAYLEAARTGSLNPDIINRLIADIDAVVDESDSGDITIDFSPARSETLVGTVADYTRNLAEANKAELSELDQHAPDLQNGTIIDLRRYLEIQARILGEAA